MTMAKERQLENACVVVLGDIGRSPRMSYHTVSLMENNYHVDLIGYMETRPLADITDRTDQCRIHQLTAVPGLDIFPAFIRFLFKLIWQSISLLIALICIKRPKFLLLQNPPGVPALVICYLYAKCVRSRLVIDWHNYTYSILALNLSRGEQNVIARLAKCIEHYFGSKADANFCVTKAMHLDLVDNWKLKNVTVLYDRPPLQFHPIDLTEKHEIFMKLSENYEQFRPSAEVLKESMDALEVTKFTMKMPNGLIAENKRDTAILISSTSWTPDEDFGVLLKALAEYEEEANKRYNHFPFLLCIITGKGPQKKAYIQQIEQLQWQKVSIITPWLEMEDYPRVLAAADLGVCLHWSSSGLDLPMKVIDMFGCGLPVCAYNFKCLTELVQVGKNGFIFNDHHELAEQLKFWFEKFPINSKQTELYQRFRTELQSFQSIRWQENWTATALPVLNKLL